MQKKKKKIRVKTETTAKTVHAISSKAVATNQLTFRSVILARSAVTLSCQDKPGRAQKQHESSTSRPSPYGLHEKASCVKSRIILPESFVSSRILFVPNPSDMQS